MVESTKPDSYLYFWYPRRQSSILPQKPLQAWLEQLGLCWVCLQVGNHLSSSAHSQDRQHGRALLQGLMVNSILPVHKRAQVPPDSIEQPDVHGSEAAGWRSHANIRAFSALIWAVPSTMGLWVWQGFQLLLQCKYYWVKDALMLLRHTHCA